MGKIIKYTILMMLLLSIFPIFAQTQKVAVWGPSVKKGSENVEAIELSIINSRFRDAVSRMAGIELISRTDVDNILGELQFQQSGMVREKDKKLLGQMKGVDIIVSLVVAKGYGFINIESSFIDVEKANVIGSTESVLAKANNPEDLVEKCVELAGKLTVVTSTTSSFSTNNTPSLFAGGEIGYGTGRRSVVYMPNLTLPEIGYVYVEVHVDAEGNVIEARILNNSRYNTTISDPKILSDCISKAKTVKYFKGKEELRIIVFSMPD